MISPLVYLNGDFLPLAEAKISPLDRGFLFGDGVYEVIPVYSRRPFRVNEHLDRLDASLAGIGLHNPLSTAAWQGLFKRLITAASFDDQSFYIQITRGADVKRDHAFPTDVTPTVFAFTSPLITPSAELRATGVGAITAEDNRWLRCNLKTTALLANVLLRQQAVEVGCAETLLIRDGFLKEGAASNIFVVQNGVLLAPPKGNLMLPGITYDIILRLAAQHGLKVMVREVAEAELLTADEVWMTSSTKEVLSITTLNGQPVGQGDLAGKPGLIAQKMWQWYQDFKNNVMRNE